MSLRRPPTRIELKSDDIEEYEQLKREQGTSANGSGIVLGGIERPDNAAMRIGLRRSKIVARRKGAAAAAGGGAPSRYTPGGGGSHE